MKTTLVSTLLVFAAVYVVLGAYMYFAQRSLMYFPDKSVPDPALAGYADMAVVTYPTEDGLELSAWYKKAGPGKPTVVYFHGNAGNLFNHSRIARPLLDAGYGVLLVEYRGYGGNPGSPTEDGIYADGRGAIEFLKAKGIREQDMVIYGASLGTGVAVTMAVEYSPKALVLQSPYTSIPDVGQRVYWYMPVKWLTKDKFDNLAVIANVTTPVLVVYGDNDKIIPSDISVQLYEAANEPKTLTPIHGANHNNMDPDGTIKAVLEFLNKN